MGRFFNLASEYQPKQIRAQFVFSMQELFDITRLQFSDLVYIVKLVDLHGKTRAWETILGESLFWRCDVNFVQLIE